MMLKKHLLINFKEFNNIEIAKPGFLNISFDFSFWNKYLIDLFKSSIKKAKLIKPAIKDSVKSIT